MSNVIIRPSLEKEFHKLAEVFASSFIKEPIEPPQLEKIVQRFKRIIQKKITSFYVAEEKGEIIGLGGETCHVGSSYIGFLGVIPVQRRRGIGTMLFQKLLDESRNHNPTVELFANLGAENLYRKFGFVDEFYSYIFDFSRPLEESKSNVKVLSDSIPEWVYRLDREAMGFDRSRLLDFQLDRQGVNIICLEQDGYAICDGTKIGPLIAKDDEVATILIDHLLSTGPKRIIVPDRFEATLKPHSPKKVQTCLKMTYGKPIDCELSWVWGYSAFATS